MNIGMILDNDFNGDLRVENEVKALQKAGYQVFVLCYNFGDKFESTNFHGAQLVRISISKTLKNKLKFLNNTIFDIYSILWSFKIISFARKYKIDVLHTHDLFMARSVILANKILKVKSVLDLHENYPATLASYSWSKSLLGKLFVSKERWEKLESIYLPKFKSIILLSEQFGETLNKKYPKLKSKFYIYPNYANVDHLLSFPIEENIIKKNDDFIIFYFGSIAVRRGIFTLLEALRILLSENIHYRVLLIGPIDNADKATLQSYLDDTDLKNNIIQYDWKDIKYLPSYIKISDVCVSPLIKNEQHESGIANKIFQYMLFKKPLIVSNCLPQQKVIEDENCGLVFESENASDLAKKIKILYNDPELRITMGKNGEKAVLNKYNFESASKNLIKLYNEIN